MITLLHGAIESHINLHFIVSIVINAIPYDNVFPNKQKMSFYKAIEIRLLF